jgi:hypothetical protein
MDEEASFETQKDVEENRNTHHIFVIMLSIRSIDSEYLLSKYCIMHLSDSIRIFSNCCDVYSSLGPIA